MKVAILLGSIRKGRQSHKVAYYLQNILRKKGIDTDLIDLATDALPILGDNSGNQQQTAEKIKEMSNRFQNADALLFVTPEYHGSFSGVLKNALDYFWSEFARKPIGVVAVSAGRMGGINASTQLQQVILSVGAFPLPLKLLVPDIYQAFTDSYEPQQESIVKSTNKFLDEFIWFSQAIVQAKQLEAETTKE